METILRSESKSEYPGLHRQRYRVDDVRDYGEGERRRYFIVIPGSNPLSNVNQSNSIYFLYFRWFGDQIGKSTFYSKSSGIGSFSMNRIRLRTGTALSPNPLLR